MTRSSRLWGRVIGRSITEPAGPVPEVAQGSTLREVLADAVQLNAAGMGADLSMLSTDQIMNMQQYNLFPNTTIIAFPDLLQVVKSRPGPTPDECFMDMLQVVPVRDPRRLTPTQPVSIWHLPSTHRAFGVW